MLLATCEFSIKNRQHSQQIVASCVAEGYASRGAKKAVLPTKGCYDWFCPVPGALLLSRDESRWKKDFKKKSSRLFKVENCRYIKDSFFKVTLQKTWRCRLFASHAALTLPVLLVTNCWRHRRAIAQLLDQYLFPINDIYTLCRYIYFSALQVVNTFYLFVFTFDNTR